jgi:hypothetical protein
MNSLKTLVDELGVDFSHITSLTTLDNFHGLFSTKETIHSASTRLFEILVVLPVIGGFLFPMSA